MTVFQCKWALMGLSSIATTFVDDLLLSRDPSEPIVHVLSCVSTTSAVSRAKTWLGDRKGLDVSSAMIYTSAEEMLKSGDFDIVYISTPHPVHYEQAKLAIANGRNVLLEKPATMNLAQFKVLIDLAKSSGVVLMEAMWTRYLPAVKYLESELLPKIGTVKRVFSDLSVPIASEEMDITSRLMDKRAGAGAILDMGVYALTWADIAFGGNPAAKVSYASTIEYDTGKDKIDDINTIVVSAPDSVAIVTTSLTLAGSATHPDKLSVPKVSPSVRIEATNAQVSIPFPLIRPQQLQIEWYDIPHLDAGNNEFRELVDKPVERGWGLWYEADVIAAYIRDGKKGVVIGEEESVRVLGWMDSARKMAGIVYDADQEAV
ncbi:uncharacterized protein V1518DRAFT_420803 [Limtongia smithiae]|uniref:uncharacterized protein n=1 Tax=Limtongia smithiae TaxID=1125753 RepID=UPI0034CF01A6